MLSPGQLVLGVLVLLGLGALVLVGRRSLRAFFVFRGTRVVVCPESREMVAVEVDARRAALTAPQGRPQLRLDACTRWPERQECEQECLGQIESAPHACRLERILGDWYQGKSCVLCGRRFGAVQWHDHKPALLAVDGALVDWSSFRPEQVIDVLATHGPVCWDCRVAEGFRRQHPERVTDRRAPSSPPPSMS